MLRDRVHFLWCLGEFRLTFFADAMLFNSFEFALFLPVVFVAYWALARFRRCQNLLLLGASYFFYGWWDVRFLGLILLSSAIDFIVGLGLKNTQQRVYRKLLLTISLCANLGILATFKYFDFFSDSLAIAIAPLGVELSQATRDIVLPVGISFYTFQTLGYTIDVYRGRMAATGDALSFFAFVAFFPQLVAGPIERAAQLLPQFQKPRAFNDAKARDGLRQILWGLFAKVVIADNLAKPVDHVFSNFAGLGGGEIAVGVLLFGIQIYCDFSGYSLIARGTARLLGFDLMRNFAFPYFSRNIAEFWQRWHISLSTWFRDYVYIPLGGNRVSRFRSVRNVMLTFAVSGLWHGAGWKFLVWGIFHGLCFVPLYITGNNRSATGNVAAGRWIPSLREFLSMLATFVLVSVGWVFFRADSLSDAVEMLNVAIHHAGDFTFSRGYTKQFAVVSLLLTVEWLQRERDHPLAIASWPLPARWGTYYLVVALIWMAGNMDYVPFIYFQF